MSDSYEHEKPYGLTGQYQETPAPSDLDTPYDLHAVYDESAAGETQAINTIGFDASSFGITKTTYTQIIFTTGINQSGYGIPSLINRNRYYNINGFNASSFGQPTIQNLKRYLNPIGLNASAYGQAQVQSLRKYVNPAGFHASSLGTPVVYNLKQSINVQGFNPSGFGVAGIINLNRYYYFSGFNASSFGQPYIQNLKRYLHPIGFNSAAYGQAQIKNQRAYLTDTGRNFQAFGKAEIDYKEKHTTVAGINAIVFGNQMVAYAVRTIEMSSTNGDMASFGTQWIEYNPRYISPRGIFEQLPSNHQVSPTRFIRPEGLDAALFGTRIIPENQTIYPQGFAGSFGVNEVHNHRQYIQPKGFLTVGEFPEYRWGRADVWNQTQYIHTDGVKPPNLNLPDIERTKIFNLNRIITTFGTLHQRFGYQQIENNARVLSPTGIASPIEVNPTHTTVTDGVRYLAMLSIAAPVLGTWHNVRLAARLIQPQGFTASMFGMPHVENTRRNFRFIGMGEQSLFGRAMVADAVRTLSFEHRYTIAPPLIPLPTIKLGTRYIEPIGFDSSRLGRGEVVTRFNKVYPRWVHTNRVGEPIVHNVTPELRGRGQDLSEFGQTRIDLHTRYVRPDGLNAAIFGQCRISDAKQYIKAIGISPPTITRFHEVVRQGGQYIPHLIDFTGYGLETKNFEVGPLHKITQNVIRHESNQPMTIFGNTVVTANTIRVEPGYWEILFGTAEITHKNRKVFVAPFNDVFYEPPKPAVSPHTIYAGIINPPAQAIQNHPRPPLQLHPIDGLDTRGNVKDSGAVFGTPSLTHRHRQVRAQGYDLSSFGNTGVKQTIFFIRPKGWNSLRVGAIAPIGDQKISFREGVDTAEYGVATLQRVDPLNRTIRLQGVDWLSFGNNEAQLLRRNIHPSGFNALRMGSKKDDDQPFMWQGLRIGEHVPTDIGGGDLSLFGTAWISHWVREVLPVGLDYALVNEYDYTEFDLRLRVIRRESPDQTPAQQIKPTGFNASLITASDIKNKVHFIRPDGNSDQFRKGAF